MNKVEFLKNYVLEKSEGMELIDTAFHLLKEYHEKIPKKLHTHRRDSLFDAAIEYMQSGFEHLLIDIANHHDIKMVITDEREEREMKKTLKWCVDSLNLMAGYLDGRLGLSVQFKDKISSERRNDKQD